MQAKKNDMGVSPVIAVILMVAITVVLAGVVFLWAQSFTNEAGGDVDKLNIRGNIDASLDTLTFEVISGTITWADYRVTVDGAVLDTPSVATTSAGESVVYTDSLTTWNPTTAQQISVKIINIGEDKMVWEDTIIATA